MRHSDFVHLHLHSQYSLLDGACKIDELLQVARDYRMPAVAITDHGNLFGAIEFYTKAIQAGVKPIIGCEMYLAPRSRFDKSGGLRQEKLYHITLLAKDEQGYRNLLKLVSLSYLEGFYYKPRIDKQLLAHHNKGLIALSGCMQSELNQCLMDGNIEKARQALKFYKEIFEPGCFYIEIQNQLLPDQKRLINQAIQLAKELDIPYVATNDVHYLRKEYSFAHDVLLAIQTQTTIEDPQRLRLGSDQFYFKSPEEMKELFTELPEAIKNTIIIAERCNLELEFNKIHLPRFQPPEGYSQYEYLRKLCYDNLNKKYPNPSPEVKQRLQYELETINKLGFTSYFLIVWDFVRFAKSKNIPVGPGRGSAAGSIVSYLLDITTIDPLKYGLLFERFLNPERVSLPDIDIDFCYERRQEVIDYVIQKYGESNVAQIITFGTMQARAVVRDVARALNIPYQDADRIAKLIPPDPGIDLNRAIQIEPELRNLIENDERVKKLIEIAKVLEGLSRHVSIHAAGVVISDRPLMELIPLYKTPDSEIVTGYDMDSIDKVGLMKMDFLGLKTLTMIEECKKIIARTRKQDLDIENIPLDDPATYEMLSQGDSTGVFQLESAGMRSLLTRLKPRKFEDLIAILALYRPGPLGSGMVDDFIRRRNGEVKVWYEHPVLEPILKETYGIILYQEQVMQIASALSGFSMAEADMLRRAMGKKLPEVMETQRDKFIKGARAKKVSEKKAERIFSLIEQFAGYGFNKSHSTAYAMLSYRTAYLKANFPQEFMTALLSSEMHNTDKLREYLKYAHSQGIKILPPDINESYARFTLVSQDSIRFGLSAIKNVGDSAVESIIKARRAGGGFASLFDFCKRVDCRAVNKKVIESLIKAGAFDSLGYKRSALMAVLDKALELAQNFQRDRIKGQMSFFDSASTGFKIDAEKFIPDISEWPQEQILRFEKDYLGFYVSGHPLDKYANLLTTYSTISTKDISTLRENQEVRIGGIITSLKKKFTKADNQRMAIMEFEDFDGSITAVVFPEVYERSSHLIAEGAVVFLKGKYTLRGDRPQIVVSEIIPVEEAPYRFTSCVWLELEDSDSVTEKVEELSSIIKQYQGEIPLRIVYKQQRGKVVMETSQGIELTKQLLDAIETRLGFKLILQP
ncbi:MAG TPA: DNA polymerase III subunit alpha [Candidatus Omnitrophica bacterium]|nr:DNA polymerase III subunit alpha [Candidatus Omnitrophota bacterium]